MATLSVNFEKVYKPGFTPLLQQMVSKFRPLVTVQSFSNAEEWYMNQIGAVTISEVADLSDNTILTNTSTARRQITKKNFPYHELVLDDQVNNMSFDPKSSLVQNALRGFARRADALILAAATGAAKTGKNGETTTNLPAGNILAHGSEGVTYDKMLAGVEFFLSKDYVGTDLTYAIGPAQARELLGIDKFINGDFKRLQEGGIVSPMMSGYIGTLNLGINVNIVVSTLLAEAGDVRDTIMFSKEAIGLGVGKEPTFKHVVRGDKNSQDQLSIISIMGASRLDEDQVFVIKCDES